MKVLLTALYLALPLVIAGFGHMAVVRFDLLRFLKKPIRGEWFGENKTWRGMIMMPLLCVVGVCLSVLVEGDGSEILLVSLRRTPAVGLGLLLGLAYVLSELPNSYMKRRLGIPPGKLPERNQFWFGLLDQADSAVGCVLIYWLILRPPLLVLLITLAIGPAIHLVANVTLYLLGLRKEPF